MGAEPGLARDWLWLQTEFGMVTAFIKHLYTELVTTSNCSVIVNSHSAIHYSTHLNLLNLPYLYQFFR
jgi:hypothetical protein